ncbi:MAG: TraB/GumN family protein [Sphingomonadales bacterium]|nr:TraB/GumN family protein [Sphingomonadales bacterium]
MATPGSRIALLERRNQIWTNQIATMIDKGERPFVAVGAAHLAGKGGVQALLETKGYKVIRIQ